MPQLNKDSLPGCQNAGAGNRHDATACLNTATNRFIVRVLEDDTVNVNPDEMDARVVRRQIVGEHDEHGACFLVARDILKVKTSSNSAFRICQKETMSHAPVHHAPDKASAVGLRRRTVYNAPDTAFSRCYKEPMKHAFV